MDNIQNNTNNQELSFSELCMKLFLTTGEIGYYCLYKNLERTRPYEIAETSELIME